MKIIFKPHKERKLSQKRGLWENVYLQTANKAKKQISIEECKELLTKETRGILAVNGDGGYPYVMPMQACHGIVTALS